MIEKLLTEVCDIQYGYPFDSSKFSESEGVPLIRIRDVTRGYSETFTTEEYNPEYLVYTGDLLVGMDGEFNIAKWGETPALLNQRVCRLIPKSSIDKGYLYYYMPTVLSQIEAKTPFVTVKHLSAKELNKVKISLPSLDEQRKIAAVLDKVSDLIAKRRQQLDKLDELVKSQFVEMFGDPVVNSMGVDTQPMTELCEIIDGDRGKNYPTTDEFSDKGYCLFLNAKNVTSQGFNFDTCLFVTKEKDEALRKGKLIRGDVVLTTRGTLGNLAFYTEEIPYEHVRINSGMVILRMKQDMIDEVYFIEQFKMQLAEIKGKIASGSAQPQLPISAMNKIQMIVPKLEKQQQFAAFVTHTDKSKAAIQKSMKNLETLKKSLMQTYFGGENE